VSNIKTIRRVESIFYLNFVLGNWMVLLNTRLVRILNKEINNTTNVVLEGRLSNKNIQYFSNSLLNFFFFMTLLVLWILIIVSTISSYSLCKI
jgi:hypothetical protein